MQTARRESLAFKCRSKRVETGRQAQEISHGFCDPQRQFWTFDPD
jgi:hypothetical protein